MIKMINRNIEQEILRIVPKFYCTKEERIEQFQEIIKYCQDRIAQELKIQ